ncbi:MAG: Lrp/AsnC ligand binding domain-containing protein [Stappiaceae bacterium]
MQCFFVQFKCELGRAYEVAIELANREIASEIHSTSGEFDLIAKFYLDQDQDIGHFINANVQTIPGIRDTFTTLTFKAF